jgi:transposase
LADGRLARAQKKASDEGRTIVFVDESGFYLTPAVVRSYAPCGQTPVIREVLTRDHVSAISAITPDGKLYLGTQLESYKGQDAVGFLRHLLRHVDGKLLVIWDGSPIHRSRAVKRFLSDGGAERIWLERLPAYAPDLNPDEAIWRYLKHVELRNVTSPTLPVLAHEIRKATKRLRHKVKIIQASFGWAGLPV